DGRPRVAPDRAEPHAGRDSRRSLRLLRAAVHPPAVELVPDGDSRVTRAAVAADARDARLRLERDELARVTLHEEVWYRAGQDRGRRAGADFDARLIPPTQASAAATGFGPAIMKRQKRRDSPRGKSPLARCCTDALSHINTSCGCQACA